MSHSNLHHNLYIHLKFRLCQKSSICLWSCIILCAWKLTAVICVRARLQRVQLPRRVARQYPSYGLYLYGEGAYAQETRGLKLTGAPVLFLPGNAGSYKQGEMELFFLNISISTYIHAYVIWIAWPCLFVSKVGFDCLDTENLFVILYRLCPSANETFWLNIGSEMWELFATKMLLYSLLQLVLWVRWRWGRLRTWTDRSIWMCSLLTSMRSWWPCMGAVCADKLSFYMKASKPSCAFIRSEVKGSFFPFHLFLTLYFLPLSFVNFLSLPFLLVTSPFPFHPFLSLSLFVEITDHKLQCSTLSLVCTVVHKHPVSFQYPFWVDRTRTQNISYSAL